MKYISRLLSSELLKVPSNKATVLFGMRQVGKTTLLKHLFGGSRSTWYTGDYIEDIEVLSSLNSESAVRSFVGDNDYIVIDEAQRVPSIGMLIKKIVDLQTQCRLIVTGSSSLDLAGGTFESAAGRIRSFQLWPLSAQEIAGATSWTDAQRNFQNRMVYGSFPFVLDNTQQAQENLSAYSTALAFKDILSLAGIRDHRALEKLIMVLAYNIGNLITNDSLSRECGITSPSVENYLTLLEQCFIIKILPSYAKNLANELKKSKKIYFCDLGLRNAILRNFTPFSARRAEEQGALFENYFVMERIKKCSYDSPFTRHYFWRTKNESEVDLIEVTNENIEAFEVKLSQQNAKVPPSFERAYPDAVFHTVNRSNVNQFLKTSEK